MVNMTLKRQRTVGIDEIEQQNPTMVRQHTANSDDLKDTPEDRAEKGNEIELNFDEWNVGPKLPDTGLKSRPLPIFTERDGNSNNIGRLNIIVGDRSYENVCAQDSRQM